MTDFLIMNSETFNLQNEYVFMGNIYNYQMCLAGWLYLQVSVIFRVEERQYRQEDEQHYYDPLQAHLLGHYALQDDNMRYYDPLKHISQDDALL